MLEDLLGSAIKFKHLAQRNDDIFSPSKRECMTPANAPEMDEMCQEEVELGAGEVFEPKQSWAGVQPFMFKAFE